ncbi:hypothetical protein TNCV_2979081 [Trichonephila clavipes]|nr:hypothetical protein TNCV_2979081 [Trichonephila clavipes]
MRLIFELAVTSPNNLTKPTGGLRASSDLAGTRPLYIMSLQWHQDSNPQHTGCEVVMITTRPQRPLKREVVWGRSLASIGNITTTVNRWSGQNGLNKQMLNLDTSGLSRIPISGVKQELSAEF